MILDFGGRRVESKNSRERASSVRNYTRLRLGLFVGRHSGLKPRGVGEGAITKQEATSQGVSGGRGLRAASDRQDYIQTITRCPVAMIALGVPHPTA